MNGRKRGGGNSRRGGAARREREQDNSPLAAMRRWSGFETQSEGWRAGYEWAHDRGEHAALGIFEAISAHGHDLDSTWADQFENGADFAQKEQTGG